MAGAATFVAGDVELVACRGELGVNLNDSWRLAYPDACRVVDPMKGRRRIGIACVGRGMPMPGRRGHPEG
jgi:hypothetical protein